MPQICIDAWKDVCKTQETDLSGTRTDITDCEVYDTRAKDCENIILEIDIGVEL